MYEIAFLENGHLVRGGIKAPLRDVEEWLWGCKKQSPNVEWAIVPASPEAVTKEELYAELDAFMERGDSV